MRHQLTSCIKYKNIELRIALLDRADQLPSKQ